MAARFEDGTIQLLSLDTARDSIFQDPRLHEAWNSLSGRSTEIAQSTHAGLYDFMESERCLFIAAIMRKPSQSALDEYQGWVDMGLTPDFMPPPPGNTIAGIIYATSTDMEGTLNIGLSVCADAQGRGLGSRAVRLLMAWAFGELRVHRVQAHVIDFADDSSDVVQQMLTALGFVREGTARRALLCPGGSDGGPASGLWRNVISYALLDTEWTVQEAVRPSVKSMWDALFARHEQESEEHVRIEERTEQRRRHRARMLALMGRETNTAPQMGEVPIVFQPPPQLSGGVPASSPNGAWAWDSEVPEHNTPPSIMSPSPAWTSREPHDTSTSWRELLHAIGNNAAPSSSRSRFTQAPWAELFDTSSEGSAPSEAGTPAPGTPYESADEEMPHDEDGFDDGASDTASTVSSSSLSASGAAHADFSDGELVSDAESAVSVPRSASVLSDVSAASSWFDSWEETGAHPAGDDPGARSE